MLNYSEKNAQVEYNNARRAAELCLSDPDDFSPVYLQVASSRMLHAISRMAAPCLEAGDCEDSTPIEIQTLADVNS